MEKTKLNLSVPLISVRRINSNVRYSEGVNRKNVENPQPNRQQQEQQPLCVPKSDCELSEVTKPVAVPFCWEQAPGKRRGENGGKVYPCEDASTMPRLPPGRKPDSRRFYSCERPCHEDSFRFQTEPLALENHAAIMDSLVESMLAKGEFDVEGRECASANPDVLDESLSLNCSVGDLSGCQGLDVEEEGRDDVKPFGAISADSHSRDFMMSRFLPAAKAAVLEPPQFVPKNDLLVTEHPRLVKETVVGVERKPLAKKYEPYVMSYYSDYEGDVVTENEDETNDNMSTDQHKRSRKFWKLFPRLSVKSSLGMLNPFPGTKSKSQAPTSSTNDVKRLTRNAPSGPLNKARKAYSGPIEKQSYDAIYKQRFRSGALSGELCKSDKRSLSNQLFCSSDGQYSHRGSRSGAISPYRNVTTSSRFNEGTGFLGVPREAENLKGTMFSSFREVDSHFWDTPIESTFKGESDSPSNVVEKTVYVDSVNYVKATSLDLCSSKPKGVMDSVENLTTMTSRIVEQTSSAAAKSCIRTQSALGLGQRLNPEEFKDFPERTSSNPNQEPNQKRGSRELSAVHHNGNTSRSSRENFKPDYRSYSDVTSSLSPYPPLPKSPSESWLWRTLPSIPSNQSPRATNTATKREITPSSCSEHRCNSYYTEELIPYGSHIW
nr:uncharacterized protein LOC109171415 [Ipomoea batatas]